MFQSISDFIDELKALGPDGVFDKLVRVQIEQEQKNTALTEYSLRAAYMTTEGDLHQLLIPCGASPPKVNSGIPDGKQVAKEMLAELTGELESLQLKVRRGMYVS